MSCVHREAVHTPVNNQQSQNKCLIGNCLDCSIFLIVVRLVDGPHFLSGRLEICHSGTWGTVCDDSFSDAAADVVCYQICGFGGYYERTNPYGEVSADKPIWLDNVDCDGDESRLTECDHNPWGVENCGHSEDIAVTCIGGECIHVTIFFCKCVPDIKYNLTAIIFYVCFNFMYISKYLILPHTLITGLLT